MPDRIVVTGTSTEVGKTWVAARLLEIMRASGTAVAARKPVQSYGESDPMTDADILAAATGEELDDVCPPHRRLPLPLAPPIAAEALGLPPIALADLVAELRLPDDRTVLIEGVGGPRSPLADDGDTVELAEAVEAGTIVLVAGPELGTINATVLAAEAFGDLPLVVFLNRYDEANVDHVRNRAWLVDVSGLDVVVDIAELASKLQNITEAG